MPHSRSERIAVFHLSRIRCASACSNRSRAYLFRKRSASPILAANRMADYHCGKRGRGTLVRNPLPLLYEKVSSPSPSAARVVQASRSTKPRPLSYNISAGRVPSPFPLCIADACEQRNSPFFPHHRLGAKKTLSPLSTFREWDASCAFLYTCLADEGTAPSPSFPPYHKQRI